MTEKNHKKLKKKHPKSLPFFSIIVPCRNEEKFINKCLDSIIEQKYPKDRMEVLVIDGMSEDNTPSNVQEYVGRYPFIKIYSNPKKITPCALNIGLKNSNGKLILWMSAHNEYKKDYIQKCEQYLSDFNADAVGGVIKICPRKNNIVEKLICTAISHPFGVGKSIHKIGSKHPRWTDTAFGVCYKKYIFEKVGKFNENLIRGQDMEFNLRLKRAGFRILLVPEIVSFYYPRSSLPDFIKHSFKNGVWAILPFKYATVIPISWRHLIPSFFISSIIVLLILFYFIPVTIWPLLLIFGLYCLINLIFSLKIAIQKRNPAYFCLMPITFLALHASYGSGSIWGIWNVIFSKRFWKNLRHILVRKVNI